MTYTIDEANEIRAHVIAEDAAATGAETFTSETELGDLATNWPGARLIEIWNALPGVAPVKKFKDRPTGVARIWKAIQPAEEAALPEAIAEPEDGVLIASAAEALIEPIEELEVPATDTVAEQLPIRSSPKSCPRRSPKPRRNQSPQPRPEPHRRPTLRRRKPQLPRRPPAPRKHPRPPKEQKRSNAGSKTANILDLIQREGGATLAEIMEATGWQAHSVRGFISGTLGKKMGLTVESVKGEDGQRTYSIIA